MKVTELKLFVYLVDTKIIQRNIQLHLDLWITLVILTLLHTGIIYAMIAKGLRKPVKDIKL